MLFINSNYYMSGSAGLASARRRRAGPTPTVPTKENIVVEQKVESQTNMAPTNPLAVLLKHNELIKVLTQEVAKLKEEVASLKVKPDPANKENVEYFKQQYSSLLEEMKETKKTLLKIQTFSMETNIEVMKLKRPQVDISVETDE
jgi:hypothetical protein